MPLITAAGLRCQIPGGMCPADRIQARLAVRPQPSPSGIPVGCLQPDEACTRVAASPLAARYRAFHLPHLALMPDAHLGTEINPSYPVLSDAGDPDPPICAAQVSSPLAPARCH